MQTSRDAMNVVRAELYDRIEQLLRLSGRASAADFERRVEGISRLACAYGLPAVARLAQAMRAGSAPRALYLERLQDAIRCERADEAATEAMLASVSVRLGA